MKLIIASKRLVYLEYFLERFFLGAWENMDFGSETRTKLLLCRVTACYDKVSNHKDYDKIKYTKDKLSLLKITKQLMYLNGSEELHTVHNLVMDTINLYSYVRSVIKVLKSYEVSSKWRNSYASDWVWRLGNQSRRPRQFSRNSGWQTKQVSNHRRQLMLCLNNTMPSCSCTWMMVTDLENYRR